MFVYEFFFIENEQVGLLQVYFFKKPTLYLVESILCCNIILFQELCTYYQFFKGEIKHTLFIIVKIKIFSFFLKPIFADFRVHHIFFLFQFCYRNIHEKKKRYSVLKIKITVFLLLKYSAVNSYHSILSFRLSFLFKGGAKALFVRVCESTHGYYTHS